MHRSRSAVAPQIIAVVVIVLVVLASVAGYYLYLNSQQPNIQVTNINIAQPVQNPQSAIVLNQGRVSSESSFNYVATLPGSYMMTFDNSFSLLSSKSVVLSYSTGGPSNNQSFTVAATQVHSVSAELSQGRLLNGSFQVYGGTGNDINFYIVGNTCNESVAFSFVLVNSGSANGYANVSFQSDGNSLWTNRYYVQTGQQPAENGTATLTDCNSHTFNVVVTQVQKG